MPRKEGVQQRRSTGASPKRRAAPTDTTNRFTDLPKWKLALIITSSLVVLALAVVVGLVVIGTQVAFYESSLRNPSVNLMGFGLNLALLTPLAVEGLVWALTFMALTLAVFGLTNRFWIRAMWIAASLATVVNAAHAIHEGDLLGGVVTGGLSLALPFTVHAYIMWIKHLASGKTVAEARRDAAQRWLAVFGAVANHATHPLIAFRAFRIWRGMNRASYADAWAIASYAWRLRLRNKIKKDREKYGSKPEETQGSERTQTAQEGIRDTEVDQSVQRAEPVHTHDDTVHSNVGVLAHPDDPDGDLHRLAHLHTIDDFFQEFGLHTPAQGDPAHPCTPPSTSAHRGVQEGVQPVQPEGVQPRDTPVQGVQNKGVQGGVQGVQPKGVQPVQRTTRKGAQGVQHTPGPGAPLSAKERAERYWMEVKNANGDPDALSQGDVARDLGIDRSAVNRGFKAARKQYEQETNRKEN